MYEKILIYAKKRLAKSKKTTANQQATIKHILDSNRQMIENNRR
jgi:hypothetical protein